MRFVQQKFRNIITKTCLHEHLRRDVVGCADGRVGQRAAVFLPGFRTPFGVHGIGDGDVGVCG